MMKGFFLATLSVAAMAAATSPASAWYTNAGFKDVADAHPNSEAITYVKSEGIVEGYPDGTFRPNATINRAEFVKILMGVFEDDGRMCKIAPFTDVDQTAWYATYAHRARCQGIIDGYPDGSFRPANSINFAEAAKILANVIFSVEEMGFEARTEPWYAEAVFQLTSNHYVPVSIHTPEQLLTRGEMAEMMYRWKKDDFYKPSPTYEELVVPGSGEIDVTVYFGDWATIRTSDCNATLPATRRIEKTSTIADTTLRMLFLGPTESEKASGMASSYEITEPVNGKIIPRLIDYYRGVTIVDGMATVKFDEGAEEYLEGGLCQQESARTPIVQTLFQFPSIHDVRFSVGGRILGQIEP